jgi:hypothetical protein
MATEDWKLKIKQKQPLLNQITDGMYDHPNQDWKLSKATTAEPMATEDISTHFKSTNLFPKQIKTEN